MLKQAFAKFKLKHHINYFIVLAFFFTFFILDQTVGLKQSNRNLLFQIAYNAVLAVSLNIVVGLLGELSLGHAGFMCVGAYIGGLIGNALWGLLPDLVVLLIAMLGGGLAAALAGLVVGVPTLRLKGDYLAITTLAFGEIVRTVIKNQSIFGESLGLATHSYNRKTLYIVAFAVLFLTVLISQNLQKSKHGRAIQSIRDNEISARAMGVNVTYYKLVAFVLASFFAGIAGVLFAHSVSPVKDTVFSYNRSIEILVMVVLGGMGNMTGALLASGALTAINFFLDAKLSGDLASIKIIIYALILIGIVIWNNAPALRKYREKFNLARLFQRRRKKMSKEQQEEVEPSTTAAWDKIPTKIAMDAVLSTDLDMRDNNAPVDSDTKPEAK